MWQWAWRRPWHSTSFHCYFLHAHHFFFGTIHTENNFSLSFHSILSVTHIYTLDISTRFDLTLTCCWALRRHGAGVPWTWWRFWSWAGLPAPAALACHPRGAWRSCWRRRSSPESSGLPCPDPSTPANGGTPEWCCPQRHHGVRERGGREDEGDDGGGGRVDEGDDGGGGRVDEDDDGRTIK